MVETVPMIFDPHEVIPNRTVTKPDKIILPVVEFKKEVSLLPGDNVVTIEAIDTKGNKSIRKFII